MKNNLPSVVIVGRPNVGKSSFFNRMIEQKFSIVSDIEGTTRDRIYGVSSWIGKKFILIDTGGLTRNLKLSFQEQINQQIEMAISQGELILFLVSQKEGLLQDDLYVWKKIKALTDKKVFLIINKIDVKSNFEDYDSNYRLGADKIFRISAVHGLGFNDLLDEIVKNLNFSDHQIEEKTKIAIIGKPNVGKSTLLNQFLKHNRAIVSSQPGTTRDIVENEIIVNNKNYLLLDTAGLKKNKSSLTELEWYAELRTNLAINQSNIILLMLDYEQDFSKIDAIILSRLREIYKPIIILINKMDKYNSQMLKKIEEEIKIKFKFLPWIDFIFISALEDKNLSEIFLKIETIIVKLEQNISQNALNEFIYQLQTIKKIPSKNARKISINYAVYIKNPSPKFIFFSNYPDKIHLSYRRFIENQLRKVFNFSGIPIKIIYKKK